MKIAFECDCVPNCLRYNPAVRRQSSPSRIPAADEWPVSGGLIVSVRWIPGVVHTEVYSPRLGSMKLAKSLS